MKRSALKILGILVLLLAFSPRQAKGVAASLPGGICFPAFAVASVVNPAALPLEWATIVHGLYSPPLASDEAHNYLATFATSNHKWGFNIGYTASTFDTTTLHSAFLGGGFRKKRFSFGVSLHNPDLIGNFNPAVNVGATFSWRRFRVGLVGYDLATSGAEAGFGIGYGRVNKYNIEVNILAPHLFTDFQWGAERVLTASAVLYVKRIGFSLGARHSKTFGSDGNERLADSFNAGLMFKIRRSLLILAQYSSAPQSFGVGIVFGKYPTQIAKYERSLKGG